MGGRRGLLDWLSGGTMSGEEEKHIYGRRIVLQPLWLPDDPLPPPAGQFPSVLSDFAEQTLHSSPGVVCTSLLLLRCCTQGRLQGALETN